MTFDEWWTEIVKTCEVPRTAPFYSLAKLLASNAWRRGRQEGCQETLRVLREREAKAAQGD